MSVTAPRRPRDLLTIVVPALLAYVPLLATAPGVVGADTKTYLYLDPAQLLGDAPYLWDEQVGLGTITHQNIGYLWPMGPFYWIMEVLGLPDWAAQRLWLGTVMLVAGLGVRFMLRTVAWGRLSGARGPLLVAVLAYMLSPYLLEYAARISVILLPWAALPWLIGLTARAARRGTWRDPALIALVVLSVGAINATALVLVGLGPVLWLCWAAGAEREITRRQALSAAARIGVLVATTGLWWAAGLWAQGRFGLPVLRYTETYRTVSESSMAHEVLRGLGYWFFYGNDKLGPWIEPSVAYTNRLWLLGLSYLIPVAALASGALARFRRRGFFVLMVAVGGLVAVAAHPWETPSVLGRAFIAFTTTDAGLSMRSTPRAVPLVILGTAVLLGSGVAALARRVPRAAVPASVAVCVLIVANLPPLWTGGIVADNLQRDEEVPGYWLEAAEHLDAGGDATRVLEIPGSDFASYRWGNTVDPITPGLIDRPYAARELFTYGSAPSANLLNAWDRRLHEELLEPEAVAPIARLLSAGELVVRSDLQYERYRIARPRPLWQLVTAADGLGAPTGFGVPVPNRAGPEQTLLDEVEQQIPTDLPDPAPVAAFPVEDPIPILHALSARHPLLLAGDGEGVVDLASLGALNPTQLLRYSATLDDADVDASLAQDADLVVTDTNRRRARRWGALRENAGYTEQPGEEPLTYDPTDQRLDVFPDADDDAASVTVLRPSEPGAVGADVTATAYGNPITYTPDDRPSHALDGDPETAWRVGAIDEVVGERLIVDLDEPVTTDRLELLQPITLERNRWITEVRIHFGPDDALDVALTDESRAESAGGQEITFDERTFDHLELEVLESNIGQRPRYDGVSGVGFAEVRIPGVAVEELVRVPADLLDRVGDRAADHRLSWVLTRLRSNPAEPVRSDEEVAIRRLLETPTPRRASVSGQARLSPGVADDAVDALVGLPGADSGGVTATSSARLPGSLRQRASATLDGDPATWWTTTYQDQQDAFLRYVGAQPRTVEDLSITVVADGRHSVPTRIRLEADEGEGMAPVGAWDLPAIVDGEDPGATVEVPLSLERPVTAREWMIVVETVRQEPTKDWYSSGLTVLPVAVAEVDLADMALPAPPPELDTGCRDDLLAVDGVAVPVRATGSTDDALDRRPLALEACGEDPTVDLEAGEHVVTTGIGRDLGIDVDRLLLASEAGGSALPPAGLPRAVPPGPEVELTHDGRVEWDGTTTVGDDPFWLVMGQSWNPGFQAQVAGADLGEPRLVQGYANGWPVDPATIGAAPGPQPVEVTWAPQRILWVAIAVSVVAVLAALALAIRRPRGDIPGDPVDTALPRLDWPPLPTGAPLGRGPALVLGGGAAVLGALLIPISWHLLALPVLVGVAVAAAAHPRGRSLAGTGAAVAMALASAFVVLQQARHRFPPDFAWPAQFERAHALGLVALMLLAVQAARDAVDRHQRPAADADDDADEDASGVGS